MTDLDMQKVEARFGQLFGKVEGALTCVLGLLGDKLGLYRAMRKIGPSTSEELAKETGLHERWVREWLHQQACAGIVSTDGDRFLLDAEASEIYANEESGLFGGGIFELVAGLIESSGGLENSFRTGVGETYDAFGPTTARGIERMMGPFFRTRLIQDVFPALDGMEQKLKAGAKVADVGCGGGLALEIMAQAYPNSDFHGFDDSKLALEMSRSRAAELSNLSIHDASNRRLEEDGSYDLITTFDCIHDMTHPTNTISAIRKSLKPDGTWFVADIHGSTDLQENIAQAPVSGMFYGFSVICCMRSALSAPGAKGLGTLGFCEPVAREMSAAAGFSRFQKHDFQNPINDYYEIRI